MNSFDGPPNDVGMVSHNDNFDSGMLLQNV